MGALLALTEASPVGKVVGPAAAKTLAAARGVRTVGDLLELVPRRYLDPGTLTGWATPLGSGVWDLTPRKARKRPPAPAEPEAKATRKGKKKGASEATGDASAPVETSGDTEATDEPKAPTKAAKGSKAKKAAAK